MSFQSVWLICDCPVEYGEALFGFNDFLGFQGVYLLSGRSGCCCSVACGFDLLHGALPVLFSFQCSCSTTLVFACSFISNSRSSRRLGTRVRSAYSGGTIGWKGTSLWFPFFPEICLCEAMFFSAA